MYTLRPRHRVTEQGGLRQLADPVPATAEDPCQSVAPAPDPPSASANVFADWGRQPFNGLFHVGEERRPGLTLALLGQTGGRRSQVASMPEKTHLLLLLWVNQNELKTGAGPEQRQSELVNQLYKRATYQCTTLVFCFVFLIFQIFIIFLIDPRYIYPFPLLFLSDPSTADSAGSTTVAITPLLQQHYSPFCSR